MPNELSTGKIARPTFGWPWLAGPFGLFAVYLLLGWFDTNTEIIPSHETVPTICFAISCLGALLLAGVAIFGRQKMNAWQRTHLAVSLAVLGFLSVFLLSNRVAELIDNQIDFPAGSTITFPVLLPVVRAYRTHGKGQSCNIQITPTLSTFTITDDEYGFMLQHRRPGDQGHDPDEIASTGYFCALVTLQRSGNAVRVLNAGGHKLPKGTIVICPANGTAPLAR